MNRETNFSGFQLIGPGPSEESRVAFHREREYVVIVRKDRIRDLSEISRGRGGGDVQLSDENKITLPR